MNFVFVGSSEKKSQMENLIQRSLHFIRAPERSMTISWVDCCPTLWNTKKPIDSERKAFQQRKALWRAQKQQLRRRK
jgi:hypothetical protein